MKFPFWSSPCRGCYMGWRYRKWQRHDGYGRCFVHYSGTGTLDEATIICSNMNWFQRHPYITAGYVVWAVGACWLIAQVTLNQ